MAAKAWRERRSDYERKKKVLRTYKLETARETDVQRKELEVWEGEDSEHAVLGIVPFDVDQSENRRD